MPDDFFALLHPSEHTVSDDVVQEEEIDAQLWEIFGSEAEVHLQAIREYIEQMEKSRPFFEPPSDAMQRAMHTLKGSAHMADITPVASLMTPMELFAKDLRAYQVAIDEDILQLLRDSVSYTEDALEQMSRLMYPKIEKLELFLARVAELRERSVGHLINHEDDHNKPKVDPAILESLMNEGMNLLLDIDPLLEQWPSSPNKDEWQAVEKELSIVEHAAQRANLAPMALLVEHMRPVYQALIDETLAPSDEVYTTLSEAHGELLNIFDVIAAGQDLLEPNHQKICELAALLDVQPEEEQTESDLLLEESEELEEQEELQAPPVESLIDTAETVRDAIEEAMVVSPEVDIAETPQEDIDDEIVEIFMEEAKELIEELDATIHVWEEGGGARENNEALQRILHTFKGGARLAGITVVGDCAHDFESYLIANIQAETSPDIMQNIHRYQDQLIHYVEVLQSGGMPVAEMPVSDPETTTTDHVDEEAITEPLLETPPQQESDSANVLAFPPKPVADLPAPMVSPAHVSPATDGNTARRLAPQESVKVSSDLMEELVNLAGETSISRGRIEEHMNDLGE